MLMRFSSILKIRWPKKDHTKSVAPFMVITQGCAGTAFVAVVLLLHKKDSTTWKSSSRNQHAKKEINLG